MAIHIAQILCPKRHCIIALVYPSEEYTDEQGVQMVEAQLQSMFDRKLLNPRCGLCGSKEFHCEAAPTKFETMQEAMPHLKESEIKQELTRLLWLTNPARN